MNKIILKIVEKFRKPESSVKEELIFKKRYYSQDGEDSVLLSFLDIGPDYKGFYVDIGALHPYRFSNTQLFYEMGWNGINIDATPDSMKEFLIHRPNDINLEIGISKENKDLTFYLFEEPAINSFDKELSEKRIKNGWKLLCKKIVKSFPINEVLEKYLPTPNQEIDFINIDIEGLDFDVVKSLNWDKYQPKYLLVENLELKNKDISCIEEDEMYLFLNKIGYIVVAKTLRTLIFKRSDDEYQVSLQKLNTKEKFLRAVNILENEYAIKKSMDSEMCVNKEGEPIPWYTYSAIEFIKQLDFSNKRIFEFGSGSSSVFWANISKDVVSVEDNKEWYNSVMSLKKHNMKIIYKEVGSDYYQSILKEEGNFDVIIVDAKMRDKCCESALKKLNNNGFIILDNTDRVLKNKEYSDAVKILKDANLIQIDFCGFGPINDYTWCTSFFFTRSFDFKPIQHSIQPINIIGQM